MNQSSSMLSSDHLRSTVIDPYYVKGNVFQRDSRYYDQTISSRRNRTPNKGFPLDGSAISNNIRNVSAEIYPNSIGLTGPNTQQNLNTGTFQQTTVSVQDQEELRKLQEEHQTLLNQLQQLSYGGGDFGTGDVVIKKNHYIASKEENATIREQ